MIEITRIIPNTCNSNYPKNGKVFSKHTPLKVDILMVNEKTMKIKKQSLFLADKPNMVDGSFQLFTALI